VSATWLWLTIAGILGVLFAVGIAILACCKFWRRNARGQDTGDTEQNDRLVELGITVRARDVRWIAHPDSTDREVH